MNVAPHAGAWIEIQGHKDKQAYQGVAPHAGAWIEIDLGTTKPIRSAVAPHAGAWIEILLRFSLYFATECRTPCGCVD